MITKMKELRLRKGKRVYVEPECMFIPILTEDSFLHTSVSHGYPSSTEEEWLPEQPINGGPEWNV